MTDKLLNNFTTPVVIAYPGKRWTLVLWVRQ